MTGCSGPDAVSRDSLLELPIPTTVTVQVRAVEGLGRILVDGEGRALYMFPPDGQSRVSCTGPCAGVWPPLVVRAAKDIKVGPGAVRRLLSTRPDPNTGGRSVSYAQYPLYRYSGDLEAGDARGQAIFNNGGPWYVLRADGLPVTVEAGDQP